MGEILEGGEATYRDWQDAEINWNDWFARNRAALDSALEACAAEFREGYYSNLTVEQVLIEAQQRWRRRDG